MKLIFFCIVAACAGETVTRPAVASRPHLSALSSREVSVRDLLVAAKPAPEPTSESEESQILLRAFSVVYLRLSLRDLTWSRQ